MAITLDDFDLLERVGGGGAGEVHRVRPRRALPFAALGTPLALKIYHPDILKETNQLERIRREFGTGAALRHENLVKVFHVEIEGPRPFLVMEWIDGPTLDQWRSSLADVGDEETFAIALQLLDALEFLHSTRRIHRDVKPSNIKHANGKLVLIDYGIVRGFREDRITESGGKFLGTRRYAAPEQLTRQEVDYRADVYAAGAVIYYLLYGREIYGTASDITDLVDWKVNLDVDFPANAVAVTPLRHALIKLAKQMLRREPGERPASALAALDSLAADIPDRIPFRVYFASALTGLTADGLRHVAECGRAVKAAAGENCSVYLPIDHTSPTDAPDLTATEVYWIDRERVASADLMVLFADAPSFGAGQELEIACHAAVPILLVSRKGVRVSRMVKGAPGRFIGEIGYLDAADLDCKLETFFSQSTGDLRRFREERHRDRTHHVRIGRHVRSLREAAGITKEDLAKKARVPFEVLESLETRPEAQASIGVIHLRRIATALGVSPMELLQEHSSDDEQFRELSTATLKALHAFALKHNLHYSEYVRLKDRGIQALRDTVSFAKAAKGYARAIDGAMWQDLHERLVLERSRLPLFPGPDDTTN